MTRQTRNDEIVQFKFKRHHLYAVLGLIVGLAAGYLIWGRAPAASATAAAEPTAIAQATGQTSGTNDLASQIESLPRYDVTINDDDPVLGAADAPITIVEFADFQCPYCQRHAQETYPLLVQNYGDKIRFIYKDFPLSSIHPQAYPAALASHCAQEQGKFWEYHDLLFSARLELSDTTYLAYAEELGLDMTQFTSCYQDAKYSDTVQADYSYGSQIGVGSTPTFFVNGVAVVGAQPYDVFAQIIDYELAKQ